MSLSGKDVWEAMVKLGMVTGPYAAANSRGANAARIAALLNEVLRKQEASWLPNVMETENAMRAWEASTPRENVLRLYKFLNLLGYTVVGIDAAIERERKRKREAA